MTTTLKRHPEVEHRRLPLCVEDQDVQFQRGLYTVDRGVRYPLPIDHVKRKSDWQHRTVWAHDKEHGTHRKGTVFKAYQTHWQKKALTWARDHIHQDIPAMYYRLVLGHDLHVSMWADLYAQHWHAGWADPITGEVTPSIDPWFTTLFATHWVDHECDLPVCPRDTGINIQMLQSLGGFVENLGLLSSGKITKAFVNVQVGAMTDAAGTGEAAEFNDFNEHEVGTSATAEANTQTALIATSGIALAAGTQVDDGGDPPTETSVATITGDATETWEEHGRFSTSVDSLYDRSLTGGQSVNSSDQVQYTHTGTVNPEA